MKKLTQETLKNADDEVKSAAVDSNGEAWMYTCPKADLLLLNSIWGVREGIKRYWIGWGYDTTDWDKSAIDRELFKFEREEENAII